MSKKMLKNVKTRNGNAEVINDVSMTSWGRLHVKNGAKWRRRARRVAGARTGARGRHQQRACAREQ